MDYAFDYALNQLLGLKFEAFTLKNQFGTYTWRGGFAGVLCTLLAAFGLVGVAEIVFNRNVQVS